MKVTLLYTHPASFAHETGAHPENAGRIRAIEEALEGVLAGIGRGGSAARYERSNSHGYTTRTI